MMQRLSLDEQEKHIPNYLPSSLPGLSSTDKQTRHSFQPAFAARVPAPVGGAMSPPPGDLKEGAGSGAGPGRQGRGLQGEGQAGKRRHIGVGRAVLS